MRTAAILLTTMATLVSLPRQAPARDAAAPAKNKPESKPTTRRKPLLRGMHAQMVEVCGLSEAQQNQIAELNAERLKALKAFYAANGEELKALKAQITKARKSRDKEAVKEIYAKMKALMAERKEIEANRRTKIMAVLTDEQKAQWRQYQAMLAVKRRFRKANLTAEQIAKIEAACAKHTTGVDLSDKKAYRAVMKKLSDYVRTEVLTDAQRKATTRPKRKTTTKPKHLKKTSKVKKAGDKEIKKDTSGG